MNSRAPSADIAVLVLSCDRYSDLWTPYFELFFRHWPDVPYRVCLLANEMDFDDPRVDVIKSGPDRDWSTSLKRAVEQLPERHVLTLVEDAFFSSPVAAAEIEATVAWAIANGATACRMRPQPPADEHVNDLVGRVAASTLYRTSLFATLWRREKLLELIEEGESAWVFELRGHEKSAHDLQYYATHKNLFPYIHGVEKGLWHRAAVRDLRRLGIELDLAARAAMTRHQAMKWHFARVRGSLLNLLSARHRGAALSLVQRTYRTLGMRP